MWNRSGIPLALKLPHRIEEARFRAGADDASNREVLFDRHVHTDPGGGAAAAASAAPLLIVNAGFEAANLDDSQAIFALAGWVNCRRLRAPSIRTRLPSAAGAPEGENVAFASHGGPTISQVLAATAQTNTLYTLTMLVGNRLDADFGGYQSELWAGGTMLAQDNGSQLPTDGQFLLSTVQYFVGAGDAVAGSALEIRFRSLGWQTVFDDVRLDGTERGCPSRRCWLYLASAVPRSLTTKAAVTPPPIIRASHEGRMTRAKIAQPPGEGWAIDGPPRAHLLFAQVQQPLSRFAKPPKVQSSGAAARVNTSRRRTGRWCWRH